MILLGCSDTVSDQKAGAQAHPTAANCKCSELTLSQAEPAATGRTLDAIEMALNVLRESKSANRDSYQLFIDDEGDKTRVTLLPAPTESDLAAAPPVLNPESGPVVIFVAPKGEGEIVRNYSR
jgi:hypothetical protein